MIDEIQEPELQQYRRGCERLGWHPLPASEFWPQYRQYLQCHRFLQAWASYEARARHRPLCLLQSVLMAPSLRRMTRERDRLGFLGSAMAKGRGDDDFAAGTVSVARPSGPAPTQAFAST